MTLLLSHEDVKASATMADAIAAMEDGFAEESRGETILPQRINVKVGGGWLRVGPVALTGSGWMGFKAMNLTVGLGVRYQVHLYEIETGALRCIMDAQHLTTLRTGATSAVATRRMANPGAAVTALLGSGPEAQAQIDAMLEDGFVSEVRVFSPTQANRERLTSDLVARGVKALAASTARAACDGASLILAAVKSSEPALEGSWLQPGTHINSVGTARPDQRELDVAVFEHATAVVVDTRDGVFGEAGDAIAARDVFPAERAVELHELVGGSVSGREGQSAITLFKSVGTGIQDIAIAAKIFENARARALGQDVGEFPYLKRNK